MRMTSSPTRRVFRGRIIFSAATRRRFTKRCGIGKFDALLVSGWNIKSFLKGVFAAKRLGMPVMVRGDSQWGTPRSGAKILAKQVLYPAALRLFDGALYVGQRSRAYYVHYRYPAERLFFSPHCVDTDWFATRATAVAREQLRARYGIAEETRLLLFAGKLVPFKRPLDLVAAAAMLRRQDARIALLVAGDGALSSSLQQEAAASGVPLHMMGFCNQGEMPAVYAAADMLILPSDARETWGLVVNEALACGRPVVVSDACGCAPDLAADRMAGRSFPLGDVAAMAAAIQRYPGKAAGAGAHCREIRALFPGRRRGRHWRRAGILPSPSWPASSGWGTIAP